MGKKSLPHDPIHRRLVQHGYRVWGTSYAPFPLLVLKRKTLRCDANIDYVYEMADVDRLLAGERVPERAAPSRDERAEAILDQHQDVPPD